VQGHQFAQAIIDNYRITVLEDGQTQIQSIPVSMSWPQRCASLEAAQEKITRIINIEKDLAGEETDIHNEFSRVATEKGYDDPEAEYLNGEFQKARERLDYFQKNGRLKDE